MLCELLSTAPKLRAELRLCCWLWTTTTRKTTTTIGDKTEMPNKIQDVRKQKQLLGAGRRVGWSRKQCVCLVYNIPMYIFS